MAKPEESPAGLPSGNAKYIVAALVLLLGIGAIVMFKFLNQNDPITLPTPPPPPKPAPTPTTSATEAELLPPSVVDAGSDAASKPLGTVAAAGPVQSCASPCTGIAGSELANSVNARAAQARGCYNQGLLTDPTIKGSMAVAVRIGPTGATCGGASIVSSQLGGGGGAIVAGCVQRIFSGAYPPPHGGCVDVSVPLSFSTR
jgi:hypothetical protein